MTSHLHLPWSILAPSILGLGRLEFPKTYSLLNCSDMVFLATYLRQQRSNQGFILIRSELRWHNTRYAWTRLGTRREVDVVLPPPPRQSPCHFISFTESLSHDLHHRERSIFLAPRGLRRGHFSIRYVTFSSTRSRPKLKSQVAGEPPESSTQ